MTRVLRLDDPTVVDQTAAVLRSGRAVVIPTDTVYGLAALPTDQAAMSEVFALKRRPEDVTVAVLVASVDQARALAVGLDDRFERLAARCWPGPLTMVVDRRLGLGYHIGVDDSTVGIRCPGLELPRQLAGLVGPLATTSANLHGQPTPPTLPEVVAALGEPALAVDGGPADASASTVIRLPPEGGLEVLREGPIDRVMLEELLAR